MTLGYIFRRLMAVILVLFVVTFAVFAITMILPGNAAVMILGEYGTEEAVAAMERILGLDKPWHIQYIDWLEFCMVTLVNHCVSHYLWPML